MLINFRSGAQCGGAIIGKRYILTAAHNLYKSQTSYEQEAPSDMTVIPGLSYVSQLALNTYVVKSFTIHPDYYHIARIRDHDIAILELTRDIVLSEESAKIVPIATPYNTTEGDIAVGKKAILTGYGRSDRENRDESTSDRLRKVEMPITASGTNLLKFYAEGKSIGKGDSGGSAVITKAGTHYVIGVASHLDRPSPLGTDGNSSNYVNVRTHANWINTIAKTDQVTGLRDCRNFKGNNVEITKDESDNYYSYYTANYIDGLSYSWKSLTYGVYVSGSSTSSVRVHNISNRPIDYTVRLTVSQTTSSGTCSSSKTVSGYLNCQICWNRGDGNRREKMQLMAKPEPVEETKASEPVEKYAYRISPIGNSYPNPAKGKSQVAILEKIVDESHAALIFSENEKQEKKQETEWVSSQDISANGDVRLPQAATLVLYDRNLQVRYRGESQISPATIPLGGLAPGIYFLHVNYKGKTKQEKIVVE